MEYQEFLKSKTLKNQNTGINPTMEISDILFDWQKDIVKWALKKGRAAIFADCGLGKTLLQLEWAGHIYAHENKNILIVAPLAVTQQTKKEATKINMDVAVCKSQFDVKNGINITNYERLHKFDESEFIGVVLDESSILKDYSGKIRNTIINKFRNYKYKLACTATPAPNDFMELGNHSEFLDVLKRTEMLATFFVHDGGETSKWRLKKHAENEFWRWLCSWAVMLRKPSDLGYKDDGFILPKLNYIEHIIESKTNFDNTLFKFQARTLNERRKARQTTIGDRVSKAVELINGNNDTWLIWCNLNEESKQLTNNIDGAVEIAGRHSIEYKEENMIKFSEGETKRLVTKPSIAGHGMNWQHCNNLMFVGLNDSYEQFYQAVRRSWRFGQKREVNVHIIITDIEGSVLNNIKRKEKDADEMAKNMVKNMQDISKQELKEISENTEYYNSDIIENDKWKMIKGDCIEELKKIDNNSIHYTITSPPFAELYTYSSSNRDLGNAKSYNEFFDHFKYLASELFRITNQGRIVSLHCVDIPILKEKHGYIGLYDFPGDLTDAMKEAGFIYHSKHIIWKDPLIEATRTKALGLMHKQIVKDSTMCRAGLPDYFISFRKPGENREPVHHPDGFKNDEYIGSKPPRIKGIKRSHEIWQKYASPVWMDIRQGNTLQKESARDAKDEKHICPLQLDVIERGLILYSNENELILDPFAGIGSTGYVALKNNRQFLGFELKQSYFDQAVKNLKLVETSGKQHDLFKEVA